MKKALLALLVLVPLAGCAHQQGAYGGGGGYFADDYLYSYGCYDGIYGRGFPDYVSTVSPQSPARTRIKKVERRNSTRVVRRTAAARPAAGRSAPARGSSRAAGASSARSAPSSHASHAGARR